jgi:RHS repeat-associated protein
VYDQNKRLQMEVEPLIVDGVECMYPTAVYIWGADRVLAKYDLFAGQEYYYIYNGHGDVVQMVQANNGEIVNQYAYDPWGNFDKKDETVGNPFTYFGQTYDETTGLYYLRARYYDPTTGRFTQEDPIKDGGNWYGAFNGNPLKYIDPSGLKVDDRDIAAHAAGLISKEDLDLLATYTTAFGDAAQNKDYAGMNSLHSAAVMIRMKYDPSYAWNDPYDYTHGGTYYAATDNTVKDDGWMIVAAAIGIAIGIKGGQTAAALLPEASLAAPQIGNKLEYVFGKATGSLHNMQRSVQMLSQLNRIGIFDNGAGRQIVNNSLINAYYNPNTIAAIQGNGRILRDSLVVGMNGVLKMQSVWEGSKLITVNLFGGY